MMKRTLIGLGVVLAMGTAYGMFSRSERSARSSKGHVERAPAVTPATAVPESNALEPAAPQYSPAVIRKQEERAPAAAAVVAPRASLSLDESRRLYADSVFDRDSWDRVWSSQAERDLSDLFDAIPVEGIAIDSVECRGTLCRVQMAPTLETSQAQFMGAFVHSRRWPGGFLVVHGEPDEVGKRTFTLYLTRQGTPLPEEPVDPSVVAYGG